MTNLSDLFPAGAGKQVSFVADGSISAAGEPVLLTAAGKAAPISMSGDPEISGQTTASGVQSVATTYSGMAYDSHRSRLLIAFTEADWPNSGQVVSGGISGTTATYGTAVTYSSNNVERNSACFDSDNNVSLVSFRDQSDSDELKVVAVTMDGAGALSIGTAVSCGDGANWGCITYDTTNDKGVVAYSDTGNSGQGTCRVVTCSGTTISFGAAANFNTGSIVYMQGQSIAYDSDSGKVVVCYGDAANSTYGTAVVGTVSGTTITYGTPVVFKSDSVTSSCITFDSNSNKMVIGFVDINDDYAIKAVVGTVSGTAISYGATVEVAAKSGDSYTNTSLALAFDSALNKVVFSYSEITTSNKGEISVGTVSGTSTTWTTPLEFLDQLHTGQSMAYDVSSGTSLMAYRDSGNPNFYLEANVVTSATTDLTAAGLLGISDAAISDTASGNITVKGGIATKGLTSLTPGTDYYAQGDGTISTVTTSPAVKLGRALSATSIDLEYQS